MVVDHFQHGYDRAGNRLWREHVNAAVPQDELYSYDDLHRLVDTQRGTLNAGRTALTAGSLALRQAWGLDAVGNWASFDEDDDGDGVWDLDQTRSHNLVNEITDITETAGPAWVTPQHDAAGNMTQMPRPAPGSAAATYYAAYDAWNRMTKVENTSGGGDIVATYAYDALGRRVKRQLYSGSTPTTLHVDYWSAGWQLVETRTGSAVNEQYIWGVRYVDDLMLRDRDANAFSTDGLEERLYAIQDAHFNVTAVVDKNGDEVERYRYTPYGQRTVLTTAFALDADGLSDVGFQIGHQGLMHDAETGLVYNFARMRHAGLGRWTQREPMEYIDGVNLYQYVGSRPTAWLDPTGMWNVWNPITWGIPSTNDQNPWLPWDDSAHWGSWTDPSVGEGLKDGLAATSDGFIPFADPFASNGFYDPCDPVLQVSQIMGGVSRDAALLAAGLRGGSQLGGTRLGHPLNHNRWLRLGPGRMPKNGGLPPGPKVPRMSIGTGKPGKWNHWDLRLRPFD